MNDEWHFCQISSITLLEGQTNSKVEAEVTVEFGMDDGEMAFGILECWMYSFHTTIESEDEVVEIEAQTQSIGYCYLAPKTVNLELAAWLLGILAQSPDVTGINKCRSVDFPEQMGTVFGIEVEFEVTRLIDEIYSAIASIETSGTKSTHAPSTHTVGSTAKISLFIWKNGAVAIGIGHSKTKV